MSAIVGSADCEPTRVDAHREVTRRCRWNAHLFDDSKQILCNLTVQNRILYRKLNKKDQPTSSFARALRWEIKQEILTDAIFAVRRATFGRCDLLTSFSRISNILLCALTGIVFERYFSGTPLAAFSAALLLIVVDLFVVDALSATVG